MRSLFTVRLAAENTCSDETDVPGMHRYRRATFASLGNLPSLTFRHSMGLESRSGEGSFRNMSISMSSLLLVV